MILLERAAGLYLPKYSRAIEFDVNEPTGLRGYPRDDVRAEFVGSRMLPGRGGVPEREYRWTLKYLETHVTDYFAASGDLIASIDDGSSVRRDWVWHDGGSHRLARMIDEAGRAIRLESDWQNGRHTFTLPDGSAVFVGTDPEYGVNRLYGATQRTYFTSDWTNPDMPGRISTEDPATLYPREHLLQWAGGFPSLMQVFERTNPELGWRVIWQVP